MPNYTLKGRALPADPSILEAPCIFCGELAKHINAGGNAWAVNGCLDGAPRVFLYHDHGCTLFRDGAIWRCLCESDYIENVGPRCVACGTIAPPEGKDATPFFTVARRGNVGRLRLPNGATFDMPIKYARKLVRMNWALDWYRYDWLTARGRRPNELGFNEGVRQGFLVFQGRLYVRLPLNVFRDFKDWFERTLRFAEYPVYTLVPIDSRKLVIKFHFDASQIQSGGLLWAELDKVFRRHMSKYVGVRRRLG